MITAGAFDAADIVDPVIQYDPETLATQYQTIMADKENAVKMGLAY